MEHLTGSLMDVHTFHHFIPSSSTPPKSTTEAAQPSFRHGVTSMAVSRHTLPSKQQLKHKTHLHKFWLKLMPVVPLLVAPSTARRSIKQEHGLEGSPMHSSRMEVST